MRKSLLPIANGQSLSMLSKEDNVSEVFNSQGIKSIYEYLQVNVQSNQTFLLKANDALLLKNIVLYFTGEESDKKINLKLKENEQSLIETDLSVTESIELTNVFIWHFPNGIIVNNTRYLAINPNFAVQTLLVIGEDCDQIPKTLSLNN